MDETNIETARTRDAQATRHKLIQAGTRAFASAGFAGVRVEQVAQLAGVNKAMIYHYFGDKRGLYDAVVAAAAADLAAPDRPSELAPWRTRVASRLDADCVRLMAWNGLQQGAAPNEDGRPLAVDPKPNDRLGREQLDAQDLALVFVALAAFPRQCPQVVEAVMHLAADSQAFQERWEKLQTRLLRLITAASQVPKERVTLRPAAHPVRGG